MSYKGEIDVQSEYKIDDDNLPDLMLNIKGNTDDLDEYGYVFYHKQDQIPEYLISHAKRNREAEEEVRTEDKLSRITEEHLDAESDEEWRIES